MRSGARDAEAVTFTSENVAMKPLSSTLLRVHDYDDLYTYHGSITRAACFNNLRRTASCAMLSNSGVLLLLWVG